MIRRLLDCSVDVETLAYRFEELVGVNEVTVAADDGNEDVDSVDDDKSELFGSGGVYSQSTLQYKKIQEQF